MASFCTKCGSPLAANAGFCTSCGTPVSAGVATPQPPPVTAAPAGMPPPAAEYGQYPAATKGSGGVVKIVLIVVAVVVGLGVLAAGAFGFMAWRVAHSIVHTDSSGNTTISTPGGSVSAGKNVDISAADLGVPIYPGATRGEGGMHMSLPTGSVDSAIFVSDDPVSTVVAFYKGKLGANETDVNTDSGSMLSSGKEGADGKSGTMITVSPGSGDKSGKTQISITHTVSTQ
jgi:zinc-ribbon domain